MGSEMCIRDSETTETATETTETATETANIIREDIQRVKMEIKIMNAREKKARRRVDLQTIININTARVDLLDELE